MSSKKRAVLGIMILGIIAVSIIGVNAGILDWFKFGSDGAGEGELGESAVANVNVTGTSVPPEIVYVSDLNDTFLYSETTTRVSLFFHVYSVSTTNALPPNAGVVNATLSYGGTTYDDITCVKDGEVNGALYGYGAGEWLANYTCDFEIQYYAEPLVDWTVNANVEDENGNIGINNTKTVQFQVNSAWRPIPYPAHINWSDVSIGGAPELSDFELEIVNVGNNAIEYTTSPFNVTGYWLNGTGSVPDDIIPETQFGVSEVANCSDVNNIGQRLDLNGVFVQGFDVLHTASTPTVPASNNMTFCLNTTVGIAAQPYTTTDGTWLINVQWDA